MTVLAIPSPAETLLADLTPSSGLALRRWTPDELRRLASSAVLGDVALDLAELSRAFWGRKSARN